MASPDDKDSPPEAPRAPRKSGLGALFGLGRKDDHRAASAAAELFEQAEAFKALRIADVMTPRADIVALEIDSPFEEVIAQFRETEHSRLPIYRETLDDPVGVAYLKDIFKLMADPEKQPQSGDPVLHRVRRDALYVPPSMRAADLLVKMQADRTHMALVIDEFGGVDGLVTLEDVIESVVGEIDDEHDEAVPAQIVARAGGTYEADARAPLDDLEKVLELSLVPPDLEDEEIETVAGLVVALAGRVPQRGEVITHPDGHEFEVLDADPRKIKRLRVRPRRLAPEAEV